MFWELLEEFGPASLWKDDAEFGGLHLGLNDRVGLDFILIIVADINLFGLKADVGLNIRRLDVEVVGMGSRGFRTDGAKLVIESCGFPHVGTCLIAVLRKNTRERS